MADKASDQVDLRTVEMVHEESPATRLRLGGAAEFATPRCSRDEQVVLIAGESVVLEVVACFAVRGVARLGASAGFRCHLHSPIVQLAVPYIPTLR